MLDDVLIGWGALNLFVILLAAFSWYRSCPDVRNLTDRVAAVAERPMWAGRHEGE